jgi:hypothetical protein
MAAVMAAAWSEARKTAVFATSSSVGRRFSSVCVAACANMDSRVDGRAGDAVAE